MFAYELDGISVAFMCPPALGDSIIAKKIFEAIVRVEKNCHIDIFYNGDNSKSYIEAFYSGSKNLNGILSASEIDNKNFQKYDLVLNTGAHAIIINFANLERLQKFSPELFQSVLKIDAYNKKYIYTKDYAGVVLFQMARSRILGTNRFTCLSCEGALPIYDNHVEINLSPEWEIEFKKLGLKKYITVGSNGGAFGRHKVKEWPTRYYKEFISLLKNKMPNIEVIQTGGGIDILENADRYLLGKNIELVKYIFKNSLLHVDCEGGPVHLASQLGTKCIVLFGATDIKYFGYANNINLVSDVCSPCLWVWANNNECLLKSKEPVCMLSITPEKVCDVAYKYLQSLE